MSTERVPGSLRLAPATVPQPAKRGRANHLRVVERNPRRRLGRAWAAVAALVFVGLLTLAAVQALLVQGQIKLDALDNKVADQQQEYQRVRLEVARLEAPSRVVAEARSRLGMVVPEDVTYLTPDEVEPSDDHADNKSDDTWFNVKRYLERGA